MSTKRRRRFTQEFKIEAVKLANSSDKTMEQIARELDITSTMLYNWRKKYNTFEFESDVSVKPLSSEQLKIKQLELENARLREERDILKKATVDSIGHRNTLHHHLFWRLKFQCLSRAFIEKQRLFHSVSRLCQVLSVSRSGYYDWFMRSPSFRQLSDNALTNRIVQIHQSSRCTYGSPRIHAQLKREGCHVSRKRVARIMRELGLKAKSKRRFKATTNSKHNKPVAPNLLARQFSPIRADIAWAADITYISTDEGWLYLATVIDLYSRKIIGWSMAERMKTTLVLNALIMAVKARQPQPDLIHHSDRGVQYASEEYQLELERNGIRC